MLKNHNKSNNLWYSTISSSYSIIGKELIPKGFKTSFKFLSQHYSDRKLATKFELLKRSPRHLSVLWYLWHSRTDRVRKNVDLLSSYGQGTTKRYKTWSPIFFRFFWSPKIFSFFLSFFNKRKIQRKAFYEVRRTLNYAIIVLLVDFRLFNVAFQ